MPWGRYARALLRAPVQVAATTTRAAVQGSAAALNTAVLTAGVGVAVATVPARVGVALLSPVASAPVRTSRAAVHRASSTVAAQARTGVAGEFVSLVDPRPRRHQRRVSTQADSAHIEVRGLTGGTGRKLARTLNEQMGDTPGVRWWRVNAVTGRLAVGFEPARLDITALLALVSEVEQRAGTATETWSRRHPDHPSDREPVLAAAAEVLGDLTGVMVATAGGVFGLPHSSEALRAALALVDAQPRLRRVVEAYLGADRTDLLITLLNAAALALGRGTPSLLVDAGQCSTALLENMSRRAAWQRWAQGPAGATTAAVLEPLVVPPRPCPLPPGPIERFADQAAAGSLAASLATLAGQRRLADAPAAVLVGVPRASRTSRESFASTLSTVMSRRGVLSLDTSMWRRLDRVSAVIVDSHAVRGDRALVLDAQAHGPGWSTEHVWSAAQRLLWTEGQGRQPASLPIPPPRGRAGSRLTLTAARRRHHRDARPGDPSWRELRENGVADGRALVGSELHPRADSVLAAARRSELRVVLVGDASTTDLRPRADEFVASGGSTTALVRRLQEQGHVVALVSRDSHRALAAADVAIGLTSLLADGAVQVPWSADLICDDLRPVEQLLAATAPARRVSERGRTLALSASTLGGLLLVAGPRRGARVRATSPVTAAAFAGITSGVLSGWRAGRLSGNDAVPLVPWHALEADEALARLPAAPRKTHRPTPPRRAWPLELAEAVLHGVHQLADRPLAAPVRRPASAALRLSRHVRDELGDPLTPVLSVGAAASAIIGSPTDAALVSSVMGVNALMSALQRQRADAALHQLFVGEQTTARRLAGPRARSLAHDELGRAGTRVPATALRPGEVIALRTGDVVPADARLLAVDGLEMDESGLTGESVTVDKQSAATPGAALAERACMVYEGSTVVAGAARAVVVAVGAGTQAGRAVAAAKGPPPGGVQAQLRALTDKALPLTLGGGAAVAGGAGARAAACGRPSPTALPLRWRPCPKVCRSSPRSRSWLRRVGSPAVGCWCAPVAPSRLWAGWTPSALTRPARSPRGGCGWWRWPISTRNGTPCMPRTPPMPAGCSARPRAHARNPRRDPSSTRPTAPCSRARTRTSANRPPTSGTRWRSCPSRATEVMPPRSATPPGTCVWWSRGHRRCCCPAAPAPCRRPRTRRDGGFADCPPSSASRPWPWSTGWRAAASGCWSWPAETSPRRRTTWNRPSKSSRCWALSAWPTLPERPPCPWSASSPATTSASG